MGNPQTERRKAQKIRAKARAARSLSVADSGISVTSVAAHKSTPVEAISAPKANAKASVNPSDPIHAFFRKYPTFNFNPAANYLDEFERLRKQQKWPTKKQLKKSSNQKTPQQLDKEEAYQRIKGAFGTAVAAAFGQDFGTNVEDLSAWREICEPLEIEPEQETVRGYKKLMKKTHVNLVDLHVYRRQRGVGVPRPELFRNVWELRKYTMEEEKIFPKAQAKGTLLKFLLRKIFSAS
ncbi:hypothetical protein BJ508DRAFT_414328 [Ascobolus immersus RN42]|uniref:Uncharacterized protein n=1 Tax=Ascobolus immersus RN42 TaxID=1160509 RepID=A0A3N4IKB1_ASCIM|nr:hypothetical protein BJ508DRAFT_414328 [Ascobolus immersus RN42]